MIAALFALIRSPGHIYVLITNVNNMCVLVKIYSINMCLNKVVPLSLLHCHIYNNFNLRNNSNVRNKGLTYITYNKNYYSCALNIIMQSPSPDTPSPAISISRHHSPPPPSSPAISIPRHPPHPVLISIPRHPPVLPCNLHPQTPPPPSSLSISIPRHPPPSSSAISIPRHPPSSPAISIPRQPTSAIPELPIFSSSRHHDHHQHHHQHHQGHHYHCRLHVDSLVLGLLPDSVEPAASLIYIRIAPRMAVTSAI